MRSILTRSKPNCFTYLHQIQKKCKIWATNEREQVTLFKACVQEYQLTKAEADATENIVLHVPESALQKLSKLAATYGMTKGPITHAGIASKALRLGYSMKVDVDFYVERMSNTEPTIQLILDRVISDFSNSPIGMRTSAGDERIQSMQKICRMFLLYMEDLASKLPAEAVQAETPALWDSFKLGCFDEHFLDLRVLSLLFVLFRTGA